MMTSTILLLLVAAVSTIAISPPAHPSLIVRRRRDISTGSKEGSGTGAVAFSGSSSSSSSSGAGNGFATSISSRTGYPTNEVGPNSESAGGYNSVNPGAYGYNDFYLPNPAYNNQYGGGYPDFNRFFQEYMGFMQRLAQQQAAYAPNGTGNLHPGPNLTSWTHYGTWSTSPTPASSVASTLHQHATNGVLAQSALYYNTPVSSAHQYVTPTAHKHVSKPPFTYNFTSSYNYPLNNIPSTVSATQQIKKPNSSLQKVSKRKRTKVPITQQQLTNQVSTGRPTMLLLPTAVETTTLRPPNYSSSPVITTQQYPSNYPTHFSRPVSHLQQFTNSPVQQTSAPVSTFHQFLHSPQQFSTPVSTSQQLSTSTLPVQHYFTWSQTYPQVQYTAPMSTNKDFSITKHFSMPNSVNNQFSKPVLTNEVATPSSTNQIVMPTFARRYVSTPIKKRLSKRKSNYKRINKSKRNYNGLIFNPLYNSAPISTRQYYSPPSSTAKHFSNPNASGRQLQSTSYTLSPSGQPLKHHFSKSSALVSLNTGEIHTRGAFGPGDYGTPQNGFYFPGPNNYGGNYGGNFGGHPGNGNGVSASASASLTPRGGFGSASISPPPQGDPGLATRMGSVPSSGDGNFAVFSSSSSGSSDVNGERKTYKEATSVINDNGKVTTFHVSDP